MIYSAAMTDRQFIPRLHSLSSCLTWDDRAGQLRPAHAGETLQGVHVVAVDADDVRDEGLVAVSLARPGGDVAQIVDVAGGLVEQSVGHPAAPVSVELPCLHGVQ